MSTPALTTTTFDSLNLLAPIRRAVAEEGYTTPTAIQAAAIPPLLEGRDVLGCAQTGTGKTAAFALPILHRLGESRREATPNAPQVLVLAPTRELAAQIGESFATYGRNLRLRHAVIFGGVGQGTQVRDLSRGVHVLIATPGRLLDLMKQGHVKLGRLDVFVLDEADRMLDMGFLPDLKRIVAALPTRRQSLFFSATLAPPIAELANRLLTDPVRIDVTPKVRSVERIEQQVIFVEKHGKRDLLRQVVTGPEVGRTVVFTRTKRGADVVAKHLEQSGIGAAAIHGNKSQNARQRTLARFRGNGLRVLVATDLAARGIDIDGITHVVNYELPTEPETYVHRIGRTGRAGAGGVAVTFCAADERAGLRAIERLIGKKVPVLGGEPAAPEAGDRPATSETGHRRPQGRRPSQSRRPGQGQRPARTPGPRPQGERSAQGERPSHAHGGQRRPASRRPRPAATS